jgi:hypothetical protein
MYQIYLFIHDLKGLTFIDDEEYKLKHTHLHIYKINYHICK